jgi:hypothetical protein
VSPRGSESSTDSAAAGQQSSGAATGEASAPAASGHAARGGALTCPPLQRDLLCVSILVVGQDVLWLQVEKSILHKKLLTKTYFWVRHLI